MVYTFLPAVPVCCCCPLGIGCWIISLWKIYFSFDHANLLQNCPDLHDKMKVSLIIFNVLSYITGVYLLIAIIIFICFGLCHGIRSFTADAFVAAIFANDVFKAMYYVLVVIRVNVYPSSCDFFNKNEKVNETLSRYAGGIEIGMFTETSTPKYYNFGTHIALLLVDLFFMIIVNSYAYFYLEEDEAIREARKWKIQQQRGSKTLPPHFGEDREHFKWRRESHSHEEKESRHAAFDEHEENLLRSEVEHQHSVSHDTEPTTHQTTVIHDAPQSHSETTEHK